MDVSPLDMLGMLDKAYVGGADFSKYLVANALDIEYCFINETGESPNPMTAGFKLAVTVSAFLSCDCARFLGNAGQMS